MIDWFIVFGICNILLVSFYAGITTFYALTNNYMLKEQQKVARKLDILYAIENLYSPLLKVTNDYIINLVKISSVEDNENQDVIKQAIKDFYDKFNDDILDIQSSYQHILMADDSLETILDKLNVKFLFDVCDSENINNFKISPGNQIIIPETIEHCFELMFYINYQIEMYMNEFKALSSVKNKKSDETVKFPDFLKIKEATATRF